MIRSKTLAHICAFLVVCMWSVSFVATKYLLTEYSPLQIMLMRFTLAYLSVLLIHPKGMKLGLKDELRFLILGISGGSAYYFLENYALTYTLASNISIIISSAPMLTAVLAHFLTKEEKMHRNTFIGFGAAIIGVAMVVFNGTVLLKLSPVGDLLTLGAALSWAVYSVLLRPYARKYNTFIVTRRVMFWSVMTTVPMVLAEGKAFSPAILHSPVLIISLVFLGCFCGALCYVAWNPTIARLGVIVTNNYIYLIPFITMVASYFLLDEPITLMAVTGAVLITAGVILSSISPRKKTSRTGE